MDARDSLEVLWVKWLISNQGVDLGEVEAMMDRLWREEKPENANEEKFNLEEDLYANMPDLVDSDCE
jgi:hypothetical protein